MRTFYLVLFILLTFFRIGNGEVISKPHIEAATVVKFSDIKIVPKIITHLDIPMGFPKVNLVTGEYVESSEDLLVAGVEPLSFHRFYAHLSPSDFRYGGWNINPENMLIANFGWEGLKLFASVGDKSGSIVSLHPNKKRQFPANLKERYGAENPLCFNLNDDKDHSSLTVAVWKSNAHAEKFAWQGLVYDDEGMIKEFSTPVYEWHKQKTLILDPPSWRGDFSPEFWIPYIVPIKREILPSGNVIRYEYAKWREDKNFPTPYLLSSIKLYNKNETTLIGKLDINYEKYCWKYEEELAKSRQGMPIKFKELVEEVSAFTVLGSDKRHCSFQNTQRNSADAPVLLASATTPQEQIKYSYNKTLLTAIDKGNGRIFKTEYEPTTEKVAAQYAPIGPNGEMAPLFRFAYQKDSTLVFDAENNPTCYRFDEKKRLTSIENYQNGAIESVERNTWDEKGRLSSTTFEDAKGHVLKKIAFKYDSRGNVLQKTESGIGGDSYSVYYAYANEGTLPNLKVSEKDDKKEIRYSYKPETNLLASEIVYEGNNIRKRTFYTYDDCAICTKIINDDGKTLDEKDLKGVTYRKITSIKPRRELPCFGLAESIEERTIDGRGNEIFLGKIVYSYHPSGKIEREEHYDGQNVFRFAKSNEYDEKERLRKAYNALGECTSYEYDRNNNLIATKGPRFEKKWVYDKANRPILEKIEEVTLRKVYNLLGRVVEEIDSSQNSTKYAYDHKGRLTEIVYPDGGVIRKEYDSLGNVVKETDQNGYVTQKEYNFRGNPTYIVYPDGTSEHFQYYPDGSLKEQVDKNGAKTTYAYDIFGNPVKTEIFLNGKLFKSCLVTYSPFHKLSETDGDGITTLYAYDFAGRKIFEKRGDLENKYFYDSLGRLNRTLSQDGNFIQEFDLLGRVVEERYEDLAGKVLLRENYTYDADGNKTQIITCEGITNIEYNAQNLPLRKVSADGKLTTYAYAHRNSFIKMTLNPDGTLIVETNDPCGRIRDYQVKNPSKENIQHREYFYDLAGNCTEILEHIYENKKPSRTYSKRFEYGPMGRIEKLTEGEGRATSYLYDGKGRLKTILKPDGCELNHVYDDLGRLTRLSSSTKDVNYVYTYDKSGRLLSANGLSRTYDNYGNLTKEKLDNGYVLKSTYDPIGKRKTFTFPDGSKVSYSYVSKDLYEVKFNDLSYIYEERNLSGKPKKMTLPVSLGVIGLSYDPCLRLEQLQTNHFSSRQAFDEKGNLNKYVFKDPLGEVTNTYAYDHLNQLISENGDVHRYDSFYNRLSQNDKIASFNEYCQIIHDGNQEYKYDLNGNLIQAGSTLLSYDSLDRLIKVQIGRKTYEYSYDALNRRMTKTTPSKTIHYIWDDKNEVGSSNGDLKVIGNGNTCFVVLNGETFVPIEDFRGSIVTLIGVKGAALETYRYNAFGEKMNAHALSPWRFLAKRVDEETGFVFLDGKYYVPFLGRWLTPMKNEEPNPYTFERNSPLKANGWRVLR